MIPGFTKRQGRKRKLSRALFNPYIYPVIFLCTFMFCTTIGQCHVPFTIILVNSGFSKLCYVHCQLKKFTFDGSLEKAILYAVGNTLVCENIEEAKELSWSRERYKVVTLDGTLLTKSGTMMGGLSGGMEARSNKWDNSTIEALKKKRDKLEADMQQFGSIRELQMKESEAAEKKNGLERKIYYLDIEKTTIQEKLSKLEGEKEIVKKEIACLKPELQKLKSSIDERTEGIQKLEKRLNEIADRIFKDFSQSVGVKNIREHEENKLKAAQDIYERQLNLSNQISKLGYELDYEKKRDMVSPITKLAMSLKSLDEDLINTQKKDSDARLAVKEIDTQMEESKAKVDEWKGMSDECEEAIEELRKQVTSLKDTIGKLNRQINSKETRHEQLESYKWEVLEICKDQQISLPTIDDPMETGSSKPGRVFEYSQLNGSRLQDTSPSERGKLETEFKQKMGALIVEIEQTAPNLKALDQYEALQGKEKEVIEKFEAARKEEKEISGMYNALRRRRYYV